MKRVQRSAGFTLVEVLVVLVITALVSMLLFQALAQVYRLQGRFGEQLAQSQGGAMHADWYRQLIEGLRTDYAEGRQRFGGQQRKLAGLSSTPLTATGGAAQWITLEIADHELRYQAGEQRATLMSWPQTGEAEFAYLDEAGTEHAQWPPSGGNPDQQLPAAVLLKLPQMQGRAVLVAAPIGTRETRIKRFTLGMNP